MPKRKNTSPEYKPIQKFIRGIGREVKIYFGRDLSCVVALEDDGIFYGRALYQWLLKQRKKVNFTIMNYTGEGLEEEKLKGRKVLLIDSNLISVKAWRGAMSIVKEKKKELKIKDVRFAVLHDRVGLADFSVEAYPSAVYWSLEKFDTIDLKIIQTLFKDGRNTFVGLAKGTGLSPVGIKNRVEKMIEQGVLKIQGGLSIEKFNSVSAHIEVEAGSETVPKLIEKFEKSPLVYHLAKTTGRYNLIVDIVAPNMESIENFIAKEIRDETGIRHIEISVGELPTIPKYWSPPVG